MDLGWKRLIPLSLAWLLIVAGFLIDAWWGMGIAAAVVACAVLLTRAFSVGPGTRQEVGPIVPPSAGGSGTVRNWSSPARAEED